MSDHATHRFRGQRTRSTHLEHEAAKAELKSLVPARMDLFIRTVGIARATTKIGLANLVYNIKRLIFLQRAAVA